MGRWGDGEGDNDDDSVWEPLSRRLKGVRRNGVSLQGGEGGILTASSARIRMGT